MALMTAVIGAAAGLKQAIEGKAGLENIIVTDNGDGSLTFTQSAMPVMEAAEVGLTTPEAVAIAYDDSGVLSRDWILRRRTANFL